MARLTAWVATLLALVCACSTMRSVSATKPVRAAPYGVVTANNTFATTTYWSPGVYPSPMLHSYDYYLSEPITQVKGKTILFQADFTIHDFSNANEFYCGFTNQNATIVKHSFGATGIRFKNQRPSSGRIKWGLVEVREWNRVIWRFLPEGFAATVGKTYRIRAVVKVEPQPKLDYYWWRFFCESKYPGSSSGQYPFRIFKKVNLINNRKAPRQKAPRQK